MPRRFAGVVLCGGASRRMGRDKALLLVDGEAMAARVATALRNAGASSVVAVGGDAAALRDLGLDVHPDRWPGEGPLGATLTALEHSPEDVALVASCDLLAPSPEAMRMTVAALLGAPGADVAVPVVSGRRQWVHAAWRRSAVAGLRAEFDRGERSVWRGSGALVVEEVHGVPATAVADADEPADLG